MGYARQAVKYVLQVLAFNVLLSPFVVLSFDSVQGLRPVGYPILAVVVFGNAWILFRRIDHLIDEKMTEATS